MWFFVAVLILWSTTFELARWDDFVLPTVTEWAWWTVILYVCGIAAISGRFISLAEKVTGLFGFCLVAIYYRTMSDTYMTFLPTDAEHPDLWPSVFLVINLAGPLILMTVGLLNTAVQRRGEG